MNQAGAGSGVFNTTRQIGAVLGSASISALITGRLAADLPKAPGGATPTATGTELPTFLHAGFTQAMSEALLLPAAVAFLGALIVVWWEKPRPPAWGPGAAAAPGEAGQPVGAAVPAPAGAEGVAPDAVAAGAAPAHGAHAAAAPVDAVQHGAHTAQPAADAPRDGEEHHGIHTAPATE
jgi:hypothetical protein